MNKIFRIFGIDYLDGFGVFNFLTKLIQCPWSKWCPAKQTFCKQDYKSIGFNKWVNVRKTRFNFFSEMESVTFTIKYNTNRPKISFRIIMPLCYYFRRHVQRWPSQHLSVSVSKQILGKSEVCSGQIKSNANEFHWTMSRISEVINVSVRPGHLITLFILKIYLYSMFLVTYGNSLLSQVLFLNGKEKLYR